ncbi:filamentous hemagglutinin N-terminal domain-containing protein [Microcoleus sp. FACHB-1515]|uniref:two-partner secretion domain-containing protein n=1 Tax=Cyanophyceae TaxID=3028117 RepID=UPI0016866497|nr:filamentous hemagglutinin N-terminal domain-containing protein [Microcoleus sp. FACHB-1515]MBD2088838.1 filamentous hemagglutinin N-terminal domain-containing protein [Microcoleus sp. FACHB-1515]
MKTASTVWILVSLFLNLAALTAKAQIVPDNTLPENSRVEAGCTNCTIEGGTTRGSNLFHSFREFSVPTNGSASFNNAPQIENILTRVTGNSVSNIDGLLRSNGSANLFLLNPNGIIFGANARLEVGGAFVSSTADAIAFPNGDLFSATNPTAPTPLLNVNPNALLFNQLNPQPIISQGATLQVPDGQTLTLLGGAVNVEGGQLLAPGGRVELAGVASPGEVGLRQQGQEWRLSVPDGLTRADVAIADSALIDVTASGGGNIAITARNINILGSSNLTAGIADTSSSAVAQAGEITFNAAETVRIAEGSNVFNLVEPGGVGNAGGIRIVARSAELDDGSQLGSYTYGRGNTGDTRLEIADTLSLAGFGGNDGYTFIGNIIWPQGVGDTGDVIVSADSIRLDDGAEIGAVIYGTGNAGDVRLSVNGTLSLAGRKPDGFAGSSVIGSQVTEDGIGAGGNIEISANSIALNDGAGIVTAVIGSGTSGNITLEVNDTLSLSGFSERNEISSSIQSSIISSRAIGDGGSITIRAGSIILTDGGFITSAVLRGPRGDTRGNGGNITISANSIALNDGAYISGTSYGQGNAGNISLRVADTLSFAGFDREGLFSAILSDVGRNVTGNGGNIDVVADTILLRDEAQFASNNAGQGAAGNIRVQAESVILRQGARLTTETVSGRGGDITLQNVNLLLLRDGSSISSTAGIAQAGGDGGNITFNGDFIVAVPSENSDITADAFDGRGGNVDITAQAIFGFESGRSTPQSDITASSQFGTQGTITFNTPDVDPTQGLTELPADVVDASDQIAIGCSPTATAQANRGEFYQTGRGGIAPSPTDPIASSDILEDLQPPASWSASADPTAEIVEAQGWQVNDRGEVMLVAATLPTHCGR